MKTKPAVLALVALTAVIIVAAGTALFLRNTQQNSSTKADVDNGIAEKDELNEAERLEKEANELIDSNPEKAMGMLKRAEALYKEAGNEAKLAEVERNISSAETVINSRKQAETSSKNSSNSDEEAEEQEAGDPKGLVVPSGGPSSD